MPDPMTPPAIGAAQVLTRDTNLRVNSWNSAAGVTITIVVRQLGADGRLIVNSFDHVPNTTRTLKQTIHQLTEGWLLSVQAFASAGTPQRGQTFVRVELIEGNTGAVLSLAPLVQDYLRDTTSPSWPGSRIVSPLDGPGWIRSFTGTDPAAGLDLSETVPTGARWRLLSLRVTLVTSATVATRVPHFVFDDGVNILFDTEAASNQVASSSQGYSLAAYGAAPGNSMGLVAAPIPADARLLAGSRIRSTVQSLQAGDNFGAPQLWIEEWIDA